MFKKMKLASKLAIMIAGMLAIILIILLACSVLMSQAAIKKGISGELNSVANGNAEIIEQSFRGFENSVMGIQNYIDWGYQRILQNPGDNVVSDNPDIAEMLRSDLYTSKTLSLAAHDTELFMTETCRFTIKANDSIVAMGVMFEPYQFESDMEAFGFWINKNNVDGQIVPFSSYNDYAEEDSYNYVVENKKSYISQPYDNGNGQMVLAYGIPITHESRLIGVVIGNINLDAFSGVTTSSQNYSSMWATIYDDNSTIVWDSETLDDVGKNMKEFTPNEQEFQQVQSLMTGTSTFHAEKTREDGKKVSCLYSPIQVGDRTWWSMTGLYTSDAQRSIVQTTIWLCVISFVALLVIIFVIISVLRWMLSPVKKVVQAAESIAHGHLDIHIEATTQDEIGDLSRTFQAMAINLKSIIEDVDYLLNEMANGNFNIRTRIEEDYVGDYRGILLAIRRINRSLSQTLSQISEAAVQVSAGSDQVSCGAQSLSQGATEQASSIQQLAATITEISTTVNDNAQMAEAASVNVNQVNNSVAESGQKMKSTLEIMEDARSKATKVSGIIKTIEDIAFQTNILALNAAVEAARAGAAGKGFAVVADEVRNLAGKSSEASKNTTELISGALSAIEEGTQSMQETKQFVDSVVTEAAEITKIFNKISQASEQQAASIQQVTLGIDQISSVVQTNSATAEESAAASEELSSQAQMLKDLISKFKLRDSSETTVNPMDTNPSSENIDYTQAGNDFSKY